jgi:hypothetical protein
MRYVFWRMIAGLTVTDALAEIHWHPVEFWTLVDLERHAPFWQEYKYARSLQARAISDGIVAIAEGRDRVSRVANRNLRRIIRKSVRRLHKRSSRSTILTAQLADAVTMQQRDVLARNKLQIVAAQWIAKTANPAEFGDRSTVGLETPPGPNGHATAIHVQFVAPDGSVVQP